jgi:hypothetical protein
VGDLRWTESFSRLWLSLDRAVQATWTLPDARWFVLFAVTVGVAGALLLLRVGRRPQALGALLLVSPVLALAVVVSLLLAIASWIIGLAALARLGALTAAMTTHSLAFGLGSAVVGFAAFALGLVGLLNAMAVGALLFVLLLIAALELRRARSWPTAPPIAATRTEGLLAVAGVLTAGSVLPFVMAPEIMYDAVYYHLALVRGFLSQQSVEQIPTLFASNFPLLPQVTYASATLLSGSLDAGKILHLFVGCAVCLSLYALGTHLGGRTLGLGAMLLWLSVPLVLWEMSTAYVDLFTVLYAALSVMATVLWIDTRRANYALIAGAFVGIGMGVKVSAAFQGIAIGSIVLLLFVRNRRDLRAWLGAAAVALTLALPWYVRAYLLTGNPVFPFLNSVFRSPQWDPVNETFNFANFGAGASPLDLLLAPLRLMTDSSAFGEMPNGAMGVLPLVGAIGVVGALFARDRRLTFLALSSVVATVLWFVSAQYGRYILPVLAVEAVLAVALLDRVVRRIPRGRTATAVALTAAVALALGGYIDMLRNVPGIPPWAVVLGKQTREEYLAQALRHYPAYEWLSAHAPAAASVLGLGFAEWPIAYSGRPIYIGHMTHVGRQILLANSETEARQKFAAGGFDYVVVDYFPRPAGWRTTYPITRGSFIDDSLRLVYGNNYVYIYEVANPQVPTLEVLRDVDLRELSSPTSPWQRFGTVAPSSADCSGVRVTDQGGYLQTFDSRPDTLYQIALTIRALGPAASGKLQINWQGDDGALKASIEIHPVSDQAHVYTMASSSPKDARRGFVYVSGYGGVDVCVLRASTMTTP